MTETAEGAGTGTGSSPPTTRQIAREIIESNHREFRRTALGNRFAFTTMKWLFLAVFLIALGSMIGAVRVAMRVPDTGFEWSQAGVVAALGAASIILFTVLLYMRPLAALERNSVVNAFTTIVINTYWARVLDADGVEDLEAATAEAADHLGALLDRQLLGTSRYMDLVRHAQEEEGQDPSAYRSPL